MTTTNQLIIWRFIDGKPGHEKQSQALISTLKSRLNISVENVQIDKPWFYYLWRWLIRKPVGPCATHKPDLLVGAGHKTHIPLLLAKQQQKAKAVVIMSPSLPVSWFDMVIAPEHDYYQHNTPDNVYTVPFALVEEINSHPDTKKGLILLGGQSKSFHWNSDEVVQQVATIVQLSHTIQWNISTSRRTPREFINLLQQHCQPLNNVTVHQHNQLPKTWLSKQLQLAGHIWVTADSASMIAEALATQANIGIITLQSRQKNNKLQRAIDHLADKKIINTITTMDTNTLPSPERRYNQKIVDSLIKHLELTP
jgi:mitochondrial fission protein ELM1